MSKEKDKEKDKDKVETNISWDNDNEGVGEVGEDAFINYAKGQEIEKETIVKLDSARTLFQLAVMEEALGQQKLISEVGDVKEVSVSEYGLGGDLTGSVNIDDKSRFNTTLTLAGEHAFDEIFKTANTQQEELMKEKKE